jgi:predicted metal-dependent hydrolase
MIQLSLDFLGRQMERLRPRVAPVATPARHARVEHTLEWKPGITVHVVFPPRARRYLLGVRDDGAARLVIPRRGTEPEGLRFLERSEPWLLKRLAAWRSRGQARGPWRNGTRFLFRGEETVLRVEDLGGGVRLDFAEQAVRSSHALDDYRDVVMAHLRRMAERELPVRTHELARLHGIEITRVTVRAQKSRWGSCSARGTISLNWRLIQTPPFVVDYLIVHELMHRRQMNHSARYWKLVAAACPDYHRAEAWLKSRRVELRD